METIYEFTESEIAAAFTEWERKYRENPASLDTREVIESSEPSTYGRRAASTLLNILEEQNRA